MSNYRTSFPDDHYNRYWQPFKDENPVVECHSPITPSHFWNFPPPKALSRALTTSRGKELTVKWPPFSLPQSMYYLALYSQDNRSPSPYSWRIFNVAINGKQFYGQLNASVNGVAVYSMQWPLSGQTEIVLTPDRHAMVGPIINAGEIYQIIPLGGRTQTRDVIAMEELAKAFENPPSDWHGDPCLPRFNEWTGVTCDVKGYNARVTSINLTGIGLVGELSKGINNLTALKDISLGGNKLSGSIPDMGSLKGLEILHLEDNQFEGLIPESLGHLPHLREVYLQKNKLDGDIPDSLLKSKGSSLEFSH